MSKVYCSIYNGIGNQLFGYALGLYLSKKHKKELIIDLTKLNTINFLSKLGLKKDTMREFELDKIGFTDYAVNFQMSEYTRKLKYLGKRNILFADFRKSHKELENVKAEMDIYCVGWGDFDIVKEVLPEMREKFRPNFNLTKQFLEAKKIITEKNSVALHIRRTDFLDPKIGLSFNHICTDKYYENAIQFIKQKVENPYFIIFSDDIEYAKENMDLENSYIVNRNTGYEDFYLMSLCRHFVLANSTYSFWGALLNDSNDKKVCVPEYWYNAPLRKADFIPPEWIQIAI
ncbi:alpha-1,2-fucosyltransferase [Draconibacterium sp.]